MAGLIPSPKSDKLQIMKSQTTATMTLKAGRRRSRSGVSPIVAEVLLLAISLIAGLMLGIFTFQVVGTAAHPAEVSAQLDTCAADGANETCSLTLANVGGSDVQTLPLCTLGAAGGNLTAGGIVPAGGTLNVDCSVDGAQASHLGPFVSGWVSLSNGASVFFAGPF